MKTQRNSRGHTENVIEGRHLKLDELKEEAQGLTNQYLFKENIPEYPRPAFHVTHLRHDTDGKGLRGIRRDGGFRDPEYQSQKLLWWSLSVGPDDVTAAETRLLQKTFPDRTEEQVQKQQSFLGKFATSPAFKETSRLGSYRFTFPLEEVLQAYSQQFCSGHQPVMRVFRTILYKQEVMHVVLVHSPDKEERFSEFPLLTDDPKAVCVYRDGHFIWRPEAMCETHRYELIKRPDIQQVEVRELFGYEVQFYVWDNVALCLNMEKEQVLKFEPDQLRQNLTFCEQAAGGLITNRYNYDTYENAEKIVGDLWPEYSGPLNKSRSAASSKTEPESSD